MKSVLITGGAGAFGTALARRLLRSPVERIVIYSRGEFRQAVMHRELASLDSNQKLRMMIGDIRDKDRLKRALRGVDTVFHAAALKRIEVGNYCPDEMVRTNVVGTQNVIDACTDAGVADAVFLSSDKAHHPVSPYGHSKALGECMFLAANNMRGQNGPVFTATRYGNVWRSTGSVVPTWEAILSTGDTVPVTDPECTRFFMLMGEAVDLVLRAVRERPREALIPDLPAYRLGDLAEAMGAKMDVRGLPDWEKRHESMGPGNSSDKARRMSVEELREWLR
jgi:UDP-N-acetylglucosamine 4,6-dehydratase/5-epimerase